MREEYEYRLNSSNSSLSGLCEAWNKVYNLNGSQMEYEIPEQAGSGRLTGFCSGRRIRVINYDMNFSKPVDMTGYSGTPHMDLLFCLGEQAGWDFPESGKVFHICPGESYIGTSFETRKRSVFSPGTHMHILEIKVPLADIQNIYENIDNTRAGERSSFKEFSTGKYGLTPSVQAMIRQMSDCPYKGYLRQLYMEGKVYELIAVFFSETVLQKDHTILIPDFSKADLNCIYQAKRLLDEAPERNVSLSLLSRCVGLNEYKLKKGFKEVYGVSVHSYVIQKRLELAKTILDMEDVTVSDAAGRVGYGNVSHFAAAFRKRYGSNPGQYLRDVRD
ncbi:helix-turn-helix domain-containing protein [Lacrimispora sp.]|uniref:helix-turn-helix domain-containing protein n=1 Tax=Lacrimispora sp. TaxID=2719234 RepID=UPI0028B0D5F3|nr:AraC family transcriptional regulator [Lacrimispora sp.]